MRAMVLAAGRGTRLRPLTGEVPKPMAPVAGVAIIEHIFGLLERHGFHEAHVNVHHMGEKLVAAYGGPEGCGSRFGSLGIRVLSEPDLSGTAGGAKRLASAAGWSSGASGAFVVVMGDALTDVDLSAVVRYHERKGALATIALVAVDDTTGYGVVEVDADGLVAGFQEKPDPRRARSNLANTGIYVFEPEVLDYVPRDRECDFARDVFPRLLEEGERFAAFDATGSYWSDVGTLRAYKRAQRDALLGRVRGLKLPGVPWGASGALRIGPQARIHPAAHARIFGPCVVGPEAEIGCVRGIAGSVAIGEGCRVGDGALVSESVLLPGSVVGTGARIRDCIVGPGCEVPAGESFAGEYLARAAPGHAAGVGGSRARATRALPIAS